jgi:predicted phage terminase large subunit-like protein
MRPIVLLAPELIDEMTPDEQAEYEAYLLAEAAEMDEADAPVNWRDTARPEQLPPDGDWRVLYARGGRGGGKTWMGANVLAELIQESPPGEWAVIAPTYGDARDTCIESGDSGLLAALGLPRTYAGWNRSMGELRLPSGSVVYADGADDGALRIQGKNLRGAWCDEIGLWKRWEVAWDESLRFAVRKAPGRIIATGTPKRNMPAIKLVRRLMADVAVAKTLLRTEDNAAHLHPATLADLMVMAGTPLGMQELEGAVLDDAEGGYFLRSDWRYWQSGDSGQTLNLDGQIAMRADCTRFMTIDLAVSTRTAADYTVASVWAVTLGGDLLLLDRRRDRVPEVDHAEFVDPLRNRWLTRYDTVYVESRMFGTTLVYELGRAGVPVEELKADADKVTRAVPYAKLVRQHRVWLPADAPWVDEWIDEHAEFPNPNVHDDQVDTGAYAGRVAIAHIVPPESALTAEARRSATRDPEFVDLMDAAM